jgi:hypothetical protein
MALDVPEAVAEYLAAEISMPKRYTPTSAAADVEAALRLLEGRWKLRFKASSKRTAQRLEHALH